LSDQTGIRRVAQAEPPISRPTERTVALELDAQVFSSAAVLRACYAFADRAYAFVSRAATPESPFKVVLRPKTLTALDTLATELSNEVIDQQLRMTILEETGAIREITVAYALAERDLLPEPDDYRGDPLAIGHGDG